MVKIDDSEPWVLFHNFLWDIFVWKRNSFVKNDKCLFSSFQEFAAGTYNKLLWTDVCIFFYMYNYTGAKKIPNLHE